MTPDNDKKQYRIIRVEDLEPNPPKNRKPDKIERVADCEFHMFNYRDEYDGAVILNLPYFEEAPEYTCDGRPFTLAIHDDCRAGKSGDPENPEPDMCNDCIWFYSENPENAIGVCMCDALRREPKARER